MQRNGCELQTQPNGFLKNQNLGKGIRGVDRLGCRNAHEVSAPVENWLDDRETTRLLRARFCNLLFAGTLVADRVLVFSFD